MHISAQSLLDQIYLQAKHRGLTKAQLAAQAGIAPSVLSRSYHNNAIHLDTLLALANVVGLTLTLTEAKSDLAQQLERGTLF